MMRASLLACLAALCGASGGPWEWAGAFSFAKAGHPTWSAARKATGSYAANTLKVVAMKLTAADKASLEAVEDAAKTAWNGACENVAPKGHIEAQDKKCMVLAMEDKTWVTTFELHVDDPGNYAFFTFPSPLDFENGFHYLREEGGANIEPAFEETAAGHAGHGHGGGATAVSAAATAALCPAEMHWEWAGIFEMDAGWHTWSAERSAAGTYADATMKMVLLPLTDHTEASVKAAQASAITLWDDANPTAAAKGSDLTTNKAYTLTFDTHSWGTFFYINQAAKGDVAFFAQHLPTEFENKFHYLKNAMGTNVEPATQKACAGGGDTAATTAAPTTEKDLWGEVIGGSFITCLPALIGVIFAASAAAPKVKDCLEKTAPIVNSFASGVIFAAALFLLLPEALHLSGSGQKEVVGTWTWGTSVLLGWFTCFLMVHVGNLLAAKVAAREAPIADGEEKRQLNTSDKIAIAGPVLFGDFFHNFSDGLVIGVGFKVCGSAFGWELVGVTVAHELPQELADMVVMVLNGQMKWWWATFLNFLCSLSTVIGAIITYSVDVGTNEEGWILAYGGGVYVFVAITEIGQYIMAKQSPVATLQMILSFTLGSVLIGLVLLNHEHCSAPPVPGAPAPPPGTGGHHH